MFSKIKSVFYTEKKLYSPSGIFKTNKNENDEGKNHKEYFRKLEPSESETVDICNENTKYSSKGTNQSTMSDEFNFISPIPEDRYNEVIIHLRNNFFADEPLNKSVGLCEPGEPHAELEIHSLNTLRDQLSVMAIDKDTDQVVAVSLNGVLLPGDIQQERNKLEKITDEKFKQIFTLLYDINESLDVFNKYNVDKIFDARILSVDSNYRGKGLGKEIIKRAEDVAKENFFKIMKGDATGMFSQKILVSLGFELLHELKYAEHVDENGQQIFKTPAPHESLKIMIKTFE